MTDVLSLSDAELSGAFAGCTREAALDFHERRHSNRWPFPALQPLAPYGHWGFPNADMFKNVRCHDLSTGGVTFLFPSAPKFEFAVIGLGTADDRKFFLIQVLYRREFKPGTNQYLVGCRFLDRTNPPASAAAHR